MRSSTPIPHKETSVTLCHKDWCAVLTLGEPLNKQLSYRTPWLLVRITMPVGSSIVSSLFFNTEKRGETWIHIWLLTILSDQSKVIVILNFFNHFLVFTPALSMDICCFSLLWSFPFGGRPTRDIHCNSVGGYPLQCLRPKPGRHHGILPPFPQNWSSSRAGGSSKVTVLL